MPETRRSSISKKTVDVPKGQSKSSTGRRSVGVLKDETTDNPKKILKNIVQLNETVPASQPDDSPTITNIKERVKRRSSRRSSGIRALAQTPRTLLQNFFENAEEETPVGANITDEASTQSDAILAPIPPKISKVIDDDDDDQNESSFSGSESELVVRKMPRIRHKAVLKKFSENLKQQSEGVSDDLDSEIKQLPSRVKKIRNKITAQDIASGIKLSQEKAAETEKSHNVAEATKTEISLGYLSVNTLNVENLDDTAAAVADTSEIKDFLAKEEEDDSSSSKSEKSSKRKRSDIKEGSSSKVEPSRDLSDEDEEILQKAKMLRLRSDTTEFVVESDGSAAAASEKLAVTKIFSEEELIDVAFNVEVSETVEEAGNVEVEVAGNVEVEEAGNAEVEEAGNAEVEEAGNAEVEEAENAEVEVGNAEVEVENAEVEAGNTEVEAGNTEEEVGNQEESGSLATQGKEINEHFVKKVKQIAEKSATMGEETMLSKFHEINAMLQEESIDTEKTPTIKDAAKKTNKAIKWTNRPSVAADESSEQADLSNSQTVSKTSKEILSIPGIDMETVDNSTDLNSENVKSKLDSVEAVSSSPRSDGSNNSKGSDNKEYLTENIDSSYIEASTRITELKGFSASKHQKPLVVSRTEEGETLASGDPYTSDVEMETPGVVSKMSAVSMGDETSAVISHASNLIVSHTEDPVQSNETKAEEKDSQPEEIQMLTDVKEKSKELGSLAGERASTDELFPSSPKETTSSGHSRSSSPPSSEAEKSTQRLTLPSSKSAFVEMKPSRSSNVPTPSISGVSTRRTSSAKRSSKRKKSSGQQENKSYRVIDSITSPTEMALPDVETLHMTKDTQILSKSPYGTMRSLQETAERPVSSEPQAGPSQNTNAATRSSMKNKFTDFLKKYAIPPKVTNLFINHYSGLKIPTSCLPELGKISDRFFDNLFDALQCYANHASRKKIDASDVELYFKRVGFVNKDKSIKTLIREYLPLEDQQLLIPVARAGNVITGGLSSDKK